MTAESKEPIEGTPLIKPSTTEHPLYESVVGACRTVYDPEIPVNIFDLGLIYTIDISSENEVRIVMTLTAPGCPVAGEMPGWVAGKLDNLHLSVYEALKAKAAAPTAAPTPGA